MKNKGISLITLIITIVVVIILAAAVILTLGNKNPINDASLASVMNNRDSMQSKILFHVSKKTAALPEKDLNAKTILIMDDETKIIDNTVPVIEVTKDGKKINLYRLDKNKYKNNIKEDVADKPSTGSEWYVDEYGNLFLVYDFITSVPNYMREDNELSKNVEDFVIVIGSLLEKSIVDSVLISGTAENGVLNFDFKNVDNFQGAWLEVTDTADKVGNDETKYSNELSQDDTTIDLGTGSLGNKYAHILVATTETKVEIIKEFEIKKAADKWDGSVATGFASGSGTASDPYIIETAAQLAYLSKKNNEIIQPFNGKYIKMINDIDLNNLEWTPIGIRGADLKSFGGYFDGCGNSIYNLKISGVSKSDVGLFGYVHQGTIKNLNIMSGEITAGGTSATGGIVGYSGAKIENCYSGVNIDVSTGAVGGIAGYQDRGSSITNCYNTGNIKSSSESVGGIAGVLYRDSVNNCYNIGDVSGTKSVGGIAGDVRYGGSIMYCYNKGYILASNQWVGGINGQGDRYNSAGHIQYCYNIGTVESKADSNCNAGGILGYTCSGSLYDCCNIGTVIGKSYVGGIDGGGYYSPDLLRNYYLSSTASVGDANGSSNQDGKINSVDSLADMPSIMSIINGKSKFSEDTNNINGGYPVLTWQVE